MDQQIQKIKGKGLDLTENKLKDLEAKLLSEKVFLNMIVHDIRNPASSIDFGLQ